MNNGDALETHVGSGGGILHVINQDGSTIHHHRCLRCGRDFGRRLGEANWQAINVGFLRVEFLPEGVTQQWLAEKCPGRTFWATRGSRAPSITQAQTQSVSPPVDSLFNLLVARWRFRDS